jgi:hypothetical protein
MLVFGESDIGSALAPAVSPTTMLPRMIPVATNGPDTVRAMRWVSVVSMVGFSSSLLQPIGPACFNYRGAGLAELSTKRRFFG